MLIKVNIGKLKEEHSNIEDYLSDFDKCIESIEDTILKISSIWSDNTSKEFTNKVDEFMQELTKSKNQVQEYDKSLQSYISDVNKINDKYRNLSINIK